MLQRAPHNNLLATPDYNEWKYMRKMTNSSFSPDNIRKVSGSKIICINGDIDTTDTNAAVHAKRHVFVMHIHILSA